MSGRVFVGSQLDLRTAREMRISIQFLLCVVLVISAIGCASTDGNDVAAPRDRLFRRLHERIGKGELLHACSPKVGQLLQADQWLKRNPFPDRARPNLMVMLTSAPTPQ